MSDSDPQTLQPLPRVEPFDFRGDALIAAQRQTDAKVDAQDVRLSTVEELVGERLTTMLRRAACKEVWGSPGLAACASSRVSPR